MTITFCCTAGKTGGKCTRNFTAVSGSSPPAFVHFNMADDLLAATSKHTGLVCSWIKICPECILMQVRAWLWYLQHMQMHMRICIARFFLICFAHVGLNHIFALHHIAGKQIKALIKAVNSSQVWNEIEFWPISTSSNYYFNPQRKQNCHIKVFLTTPRTLNIMD